MSDEYQLSELPALNLFQQLGYEYLEGKNLPPNPDPAEVLLKDRLRAAIARLNPGLDADNQHRAYEAITSVPGASLMEINQGVWELLRGLVLTLKQEINGAEEFRAVSFIDYQRPENNDFLIVNQPRYRNRLGRTSIPDLVVYLNGLPVAVLECKSPTAATAWDAAYADLLAYQDLNEGLFHYNQICAGLWRVGARYGAIGCPQAMYSRYRTHPDDDPPLVQTEQDRLIYNLFRKERLLDLIRHFVLFELDEGRTIKKLPRYQQLRATDKTIAKLQADQGGVVWHTQGSGKSLTMAYVTRKLRAPEFGFDNPTVIVMTDRRDLDHQIRTTFINVGFKNTKHATLVRHAPIASCLYLDKPLREHNLLQAIARVNRSRKGKDAGFIVDYKGITDALLDALKIFSGDLRPEDILKSIASELPQLAMHHTQLVDFFKPLRVDRKYERAQYLDKAIQYLEPLDRRDTFKDLLKQFNKSVGIVLPDTRAMPFFDDFKLFNELKMMARNVYPDDPGFKVSKEESQLILSLIDKHLSSTGVRNLLEEPVPITDRERFR